MNMLICWITRLIIARVTRRLTSCSSKKKRFVKIHNSVSTLSDMYSFRFPSLTLNRCISVIATDSEALNVLGFIILKRLVPIRFTYALICPISEYEFGKTCGLSMRKIHFFLTNRLYSSISTTTS